MTQSKLQRIADGMRHSLDTAASRGRGAEAHAWVLETLPGGLDMILQRDEVAGRHRYRLALRREKVQPSDHELAVCASVFRVPPGYESNRYRREVPNLKTQGKTRYEVVEVFWYEQPESAAA
jgi:hypothetical protein